MGTARPGCRRGPRRESGGAPLAAVGDELDVGGDADDAGDVEGVNVSRRDAELAGSRQPVELPEGVEQPLRRGTRFIAHRGTIGVVTPPTWALPKSGTKRLTLDFRSS
jgi:hypothetical protein